MSKKLLLLAVLGLFASCKKSSIVNPENPAPETIKEMKFDVTGPKSFSSTPVKQGNGNFNFIGYGYNVTGKYADTISVKAPVINIMAYVAAYPERVDLGRSVTAGFKTLFAENAEDYLNGISANFDKHQAHNLFKKTLTTVFPGEDAISNKYIYAQYEYAIKWKIVKTYWGSSNVKDYLTAEFRDDVNNLTPENLVKKYGTHILSQIILGEKFNVFFQAKSSDSRKQHSSKVGFTYALKEVFDTMSGYIDPLKPADINTISEPKLVYEAIGGDPSKITQKTTDGRTVIGFYDWISTCTEDKALFIDIMPGGLTPLYDMINDPVKKAEIKSYITSYIKQNEVEI